MKTLKNKFPAFTLIESLVSISIILIALIGPLSMILNSVNAIAQSKNRIIASYLAEETVENVRAFRDGFILACMDLRINYQEGEIVDGSCNGTSSGNSFTLAVPASYLKEQGTDIYHNNREVAWRLFLDKMQEILNKTSFLDRSSFNFESLTTSFNKTKCPLELNSNTGYFCGNFSYASFSRSVKITKISDGILKIEVTVVYAKSKIFGLADRFVKVVDYIYER